MMGVPCVNRTRVTVELRLQGPSGDSFADILDAHPELKICGRPCPFPRITLNMRQFWAVMRFVAEQRLAARRDRLRDGGFDVASIGKQLWRCG
jgi:hypothetical protein